MGLAKAALILEEYVTDNPLLVPYIGETCPQCGRMFRTADDLHDTKFGVNAKPVHTACWNAYTGQVVQDIRDFAESIWLRDKPITLTAEDMRFLCRWVRPATN